jgi:hypothetical protein
MHMVRHNRPCIHNKSLVIDAIVQAFSYNLEVNSASKQVQPSYGSKADKMREVVLMEFVFMTQNPDEIFLLL